MEFFWQNILFNGGLQTSASSFQGERDKRLEFIASLVVQANWIKAESLLLANLSDLDVEGLCLLAYIDLRTRNFARLKNLIPKLTEQHANYSFVRALSVFWCFLTGNESQISFIPKEFWIDEDKCLYLRLAHGYWLLHKKAYLECNSFVAAYIQEDVLERDLLMAQLSVRQRDYRIAIDLLTPWRNKAYGNPDFWRCFLNAHFQLEEGKDLETYIKQGLEEIPRKEELLDLHAWASLLNKRPAFARRSLLIQRLMGWNLFDQTSIAHLYNSHEMVGETQNLIHIHSAILAEPIKYLDVYSNLLVHLTSLEHELVQETSCKLMKAIQATPGFSKHKSQSFVLPSPSSITKSSDKRLNIAWITGDCRYHPVSRFLLGILKARSGQFFHKHSLIGTRAIEDKIPDLFNEVKGLEFFDFSQFKAHYLTNKIRELKADVAIDLSGWTHGNAAVSFIARVAPTQVNYLGYFGTTGMPNMDWWLGDSNLFPNHMTQWHSEKLFRLPRCFIAWSPHSSLPEANAEILEVVKGPIRFGCFNHLRKLSDSTLRVWSSIITAIPDSRLVLKAPGFEDSMTISLLQRRLLRAGLDLNQIDFLPFSKNVSEHLSQYRFVDIALDPFPNGGCTTTAEALWMGVPVITLKGRSYVSRMSTAVLEGANLCDWIANDINHYVELAINNASRLISLRSSRDSWRKQIVNSSLGDPMGLMDSLEECFSKISFMN